ncbi:MAG: Methanesulfonate monooxygenase hydroxylase subunit beta [Alphaproteobacteria bacterium MarineAlpha3_Bin5]|nr:hypothetical protein [Magnetovibrio sp.]PPR75539.1 MAG: Methanesulfonate monooxygenase hydroxylase subunit beta [Alphaproteobacteria bacterium MarineAlpha3_Bin5]
MNANGTVTIDTVKDTVYRSCLLLDDENWDGFLELCHESLDYSITAFSPEINRDMIYFSHDYNGLKTLLEQLPKHNTDHSPLKRHVSVYTVDLDEKNGAASSVSSFVVYQNMLDGINSHLDSGENRLFLIGKYYDKFKLDSGRARLMERQARLDTRRLDKGSHFII